MAAEGPAHQFYLSVHSGSQAVHRTDKGAGPAAHHAHTKFAIHVINNQIN
jgi:hypothetical protein